MRIIEINTCDYASTGNIMLQIADLVRNTGNEVVTVSPKKEGILHKSDEHIYMGNAFERKIHRAFSQLTGFNGCLSIVSTYKVLHKIKEFNPDIIHLHNLHNCYINLPMLFSFIKKYNIRVVWTLHDCWAFTGQCPHFTIAKCEKWKKGCYECNQFKLYPKSYVDRTKIMWRLKKRWFTGVKNMILVTPSEWLKQLVLQSYLREYPVKVINNGVDLTVFKKVKTKNISKYGIDKNKFVLLGVSFGWSKRKGVDIFVELAKKLDLKKYQIVMVGVDENIKKILPLDIVAIDKTQNQMELVELYSMADLFVNPTREENYPTVNMEAIACGTPVLTFRTGGSPEMLNDSTGAVVESNDIEELIEKIEYIRVKKPFSNTNFDENSRNFDKNDRFREYLDLYDEINDFK